MLFNNAFKYFISNMESSKVKLFELEKKSQIGRFYFETTLSY